MLKRPIYIGSLVLFILCVFSFEKDKVFAASDGSLDTTSTGDTFITLSIANLVRISGVADLNFGTYSGSGDISRDDDVCIWTNHSAGNYKVLAQGDGDSHAFTVKTLGEETIAYSVRWNNSTRTTGNSQLTADQLSDDFSGASTTSSTCGGGSTANFQVLFAQDDLLSVRPGTYTGVLKFIISPAA